MPSLSPRTLLSLLLAPTLVLAAPAPPKVSPLARQQLALCTSDALACPEAAALASFAALENACARKEPGACVARVEAEILGAATAGRLQRAVTEHARLCAAGERAACALAQRIAGDEKTPLPLRVRPTKPESLPTAEMLRAACEAGEPEACRLARPEAWEAAAKASCARGSHGSCIAVAGRGASDRELLAAKKAATTAACDAGLVRWCEYAQPFDSEARRGTREWRASMRQRCVAGEAGTCGLGLESFSGNGWEGSVAYCATALGQCGRAACPALRQLATACEFAQGPAAFDAALGLGIELRNEQACARARLERNGTPEGSKDHDRDVGRVECGAAAERYERGSPGQSPDPGLARGFAGFGCEKYGDPLSCEVLSRLDGKPPPALRADVQAQIPLCEKDGSACVAAAWYVPASRLDSECKAGGKGACIAAAWQDGNLRPVMRTKSAAARHLATFCQDGAHGACELERRLHANLDQQGRDDLLPPEITEARLAEGCRAGDPLCCERSGLDQSVKRVALRQSMKSGSLASRAAFQRACARHPKPGEDPELDALCVEAATWKPLVSYDLVYGERLTDRLHDLRHVENGCFVGQSAHGADGPSCAFAARAHLEGLAGLPPDRAEAKAFADAACQAAREPSCELARRLK